MTVVAARLRSLRGRTARLDAAGAAAELREQIDQPGLSGVVYFATPRADFEGLASAMAGAFGCPTIGCTTAGEITSEHGHQDGTIVAASLASPGLRVHAAALDGAEVADIARVRSAAEALMARRRLGLGEGGCFAMTIADGLSMGEERLAAGVAATLSGVPVVGGSAGDDLAFRETKVALDGRVARGGAVLAVVETEHPFAVFHANHFRASATRLVITAADPATRRVFEIDGLPAAEGYARAVGVPVGELCPSVYSAHPVMLRVGGEQYIRSIQRANEDGSLAFYCAIDNGLVLRLGIGEGLVGTLGAQMARIRRRIPDLTVTIGFDCVLRRLELLERGLRDGVAGAIADAKMVGFSTYGEQYNGLHVNQTITGVAIGNAA